MKHLRVFSLLGLLTACTYQPQQEQQPQLNVPFTYKEWNVRQSPTGTSCEASAGYNGLSVIWTKKMPVRVISNRNMSPGMEFTVRVGANVYHTGSAYFDEADSAKLVTDLANNDKAYLEWYEARGEFSRRRFHNIIALDGFQPQMAACERFLSDKGKRKKR